MTTIKAFKDVEFKEEKKEDTYTGNLLKKYLEGELQNPIMATTRRPAYRAVVSPTQGGTDFIDIQKAIDYVNELGGGVIFLKNGTYLVSESVVLYSNIHLTGEDDDLVIIDFQHSDIGIEIIGTSGSPLSNVRVEGINLDGCWGDHGAVKLSYANDVIIQDNKFTDCGESGEVTTSGIVIDQTCNRTYLLRNRFLQGTYPIHVDEGYDLYIENNYFYQNTQASINKCAGDHVVIQNNIFEDCYQGFSADAVVYIDGVPSELILVGNQFIDYSGDCFLLFDLDGAIINNNFFHSKSGSGGSCIRMNGCNNNTIVGNSMYIPSDDGIYIEASDYNVITGNSITGGGAYGINIDSVDSVKNVIVGNSLVNNTSGSISDSGTSTVTGGNAV